MQTSHHQPLCELYRETSDVDLTVCGFGPSLFLTVTIEDHGDDEDRQAGEDVSQIHLHPGGQAFWIAQMLRHLGEAPRLVSPIRGEIGSDWPAGPEPPMWIGHGLGNVRPGLVETLAEQVEVKEL